MDIKEMTPIWYCSGLETGWLSIGRSFTVKAISIFNIFLWHHFRTIKKFGCASYELCELVLYSSHVLSWSGQGCRPAPMVAGVSGARSVRSRLPFRPRRNFPASPCSEARIEAQRGRRTWHPWWRHSLMGGRASEMVKLGFLCFSSTEE